MYLLVVISSFKVVDSQSEYVRRWSVRALAGLVSNVDVVLIPGTVRPPPPLPHTTVVVVSPCVFGAGFISHPMPLASPSVRGTS